MKKAEKKRNEYRVRIHSFKQLSDNWDSYGGVPITDKAMKSAYNLVDKLCSELFIAPCPDGGILFEWDDDDTDIYIDSEGNIHLE